MRKLTGAFIVGLVAITASAQWIEPANDVPAYFTAAPAHAIPGILRGAKPSGPYFTHAYQTTTYQMAAKISAVLYQQPCYCRCDRVLRHKSLHSCFEGTHGATCSTCMRETVYAYQETKKGMTPAQIRDGIERGEARSIDLDEAAL